MTAGAVKEKETPLPAWLKEGLPERLDRELLERAYRFSERAHEGQNLLAAAVIWQWQAVRHSVVVWPPAYATGAPAMVPLPA